MMRIQNLVIIGSRLVILPQFMQEELNLNPFIYLATSDC